MQSIPVDTAEDRQQLQLLHLPLGVRGSGMARYGAAMYFYQRGSLDAETLEAYRICFHLDFEDPEAVVRSRQPSGVAD